MFNFLLNIYYITLLYCITRITDSSGGGGHCSRRAVLQTQSGWGQKALIWRVALKANSRRSSLMRTVQTGCVREPPAPRAFLSPLQ